MPQITCDQVIEVIPSWPPEDRAKLREALDAAESRNAKTDELRAKAREASLRDYSIENRWLEEHRDEYAGQWVALKGDQLIHHSSNAKEVFAAADAIGPLEALVVLVEPRRDYPFINI